MRPTGSGFNAAMKSILVVLLFVCSTLSGSSETRVYFSPDGGCTDAIVSELGKAHSNVLVQAYSFTSAPIAKAILDAKKRGVDVRVLLDKSQRTAKYSSADFLHNSAVPTFIDSKHAIAHNKIMVIDKRIVITGSFNFTKAAETSNAENLLVIDDPKLAAKYVQNWNNHFKHCAAYLGRTATKK